MRRKKEIVAVRRERDEVERAVEGKDEKRVELRDKWFNKLIGVTTEKKKPF